MRKIYTIISTELTERLFILAALDENDIGPTCFLELGFSISPRARRKSDIEGVLAHIKAATPQEIEKEILSAWERDDRLAPEDAIKNNRVLP